MAQRILVFENDTNFLRELETGFGKYGATVEVVQDPEAGIASAKASHPALVLLSVDSLRESGEAFLICKRFKSDDDLTKVPFIIMGGKHHAESFEAHKKLKKRRADEYIELPIGFDALVGTVKQFVPLQEAAPAAAEEEDLSLDVDADIDAFADNAFDDLLLEDKKPAPAPAAAAPAAAPPPPKLPEPPAAPPMPPPVARPPSVQMPVPPSVQMAIPSVPPSSPPPSIATAAATLALNE